MALHRRGEKRRRRLTHDTNLAIASLRRADAKSLRCFGCGSRGEAMTAVTCPPVPPFTSQSASKDVRFVEDGWNSRDAAKVVLVYALDTQWRHRAEFETSRAKVQAFTTCKWRKKLDYRLVKELFAFTGNRISVRYAYAWHDDNQTWFRSYGNENWGFDDSGLMSHRCATVSTTFGSGKQNANFVGYSTDDPDDRPNLNATGLSIRFVPTKPITPKDILDGRHSLRLHP